MKYRFLPGVVTLAVTAGLIVNGVMSSSPGTGAQTVRLAAAAAAQHQHGAPAQNTGSAATGTTTPSTTGTATGKAAGAAGTAAKPGTAPKRVPSAAVRGATAKAKATKGLTAAQYKAKAAKVRRNKAKNVTPAQRLAAAKKAIAKGMKIAAVTPKAMKAAAMASPSSAPHYFGPYPNYANSALHLPDAIVTLTGGGGSGATANATVDANGTITKIDVVTGGSGYTSAPTVQFTTVAGGGSGASATAVLTGDVVTSITVDAGGTGYMTPGIRKFVDTLPGLGPNAKNNLGQYIPIAQPDTTTYPGSDYYEIAVVEYTEQMHSDLKPTRLRGYVQLSTSVVPGNQVPLTYLDGTPILINGQQAYAVDKPHYLGPLISATKDRPVRVLFRNLLPTGEKGNLFLPVDTTVMGSGMGPNMGGMAEPDPQNPMCGQLPKPANCYTENRATLHLHGGTTPWISDGTPHQWITPAGESTPYPKGVSVQNVPDMPDPGPGAQTFFYTNQQSARLMFYHDHSWGITRLNVYAGEAAGYVISDPAEQKLVTDGVIPGAADTLPLIIQDKTFVPNAKQMAMEDPTWDAARYGGEGQLWAPHVYMPVENPGDSTGVNPYGRWAYGPWFWPPTGSITSGPMANPYYDPNCDSAVKWCEPPLIPGVPYNSSTMEAFNDTPLVNGTAYPTVTLEPKAYRLRILNAANDRFWNLQMYQADSTGTEVALNPADLAAAQTDPNVFPTPDTTKSPAGPNWIQIGTEGGFLPSPVVVPNQPITWVTDQRLFNAGNVDKHSLLLGPAERADTVVDFSAYAGKTLILYNDAPAAFPARDPRYDYYTGAPDQTSTGGAPSTPAGYGPNTRTIMQIKIAASPAAQPYDLTKLQAAFAHHTDPTTGANAGVFESSQPPIIVGQSGYNTAYGSTFRSAAPRDGLVRIADTSLTFNTLLGQDAASTLTIPLQRKAIQDEQGEAFDATYGRMMGEMGLETPNAAAGQAQNLILYPYVNPASEIIDGVTTGAQPIATANDGTQIWKITHNGVDTHPVHFHLFDVQLINRVGWDGIIRKPEASELGWKDTVRVSPLEDTIIALRPIIPKAPFGLVDSKRPLNPMMPIGSTAMFNSTDANANPITPPISNQVVNFGWEYVWHCHILSHEEMDMMRPIIFNVDRKLPARPVVTVDPNNPNVITWTDGTPVTPDLGPNWGDPSGEVGYRIQRAPVTNGVIGTYEQIATPLANQTSYTDTSATAGQEYAYVVIAWNAAGDSTSDPALPAGIPANPSGLTASVGAAAATPQPVGLAWTGAAGATGYTIERATNPGFTGATTVATGVTTIQYSDTGAPPAATLYYRVAATNTYGTSGWSNTASVSTPAVVLGSPTLAGTVSNGQAFLSWSAVPNATSYTLTRATDAAFTANVVTTPGLTSTSSTDTTLVSGELYYYQVQAVNQWATSTPSNAVSLALPLPAPTTLAAAASTSWPLTVTLTWQASPAAAGALIQRSTDPAFGTGTPIVTFSVNGPSPSFVDITPLASTTYYYRVQSTGVGSPSPWSASASVTTPATPISQVVGLAAAVTAAAPAGVTLTWTGQPWAAGYTVQRATNTGFTAGLTTVTTGVPSYLDTTAAAGTRYYYRVQATQPGVTAAWSARVAIVPNVPARPGTLTLTATAVGTTSADIALSWTETSTVTVGSFVIQRATNSAFTTGLTTVASALPGTATTFTDTGLARNTRYYYRIQAVNGYGASTWRTANLRTPL